MKTVVLGLFLGLFGFLLVGAFLGLPHFAPGLVFFLIQKSFDQPHRSDAAMIENFQARKAVFERIRTMILADKGLERVDDTWTRPSDPATIGVPPARIEEYRALFAEIRTSRGIEAYDPARNSFFLIGSAQGTTVHGSMKSYAWFASAPSPIVADLEQFAATAPRRSGPAYRPLEGNWYLSFIED